MEGHPPQRYSTTRRLSPGAFGPSTRSRRRQPELHRAAKGLCQGFPGQLSRLRGTNNGHLTRDKAKNRGLPLGSGGAGALDGQRKDPPRTHSLKSPAPCPLPSGWPMPDEIRRSEDDPEQAGGVGRRRQAALEVKRTGSIGWSGTTVLPESERRYRTALDRLSAALVAYRHAEPCVPGRASNNNGGSWCATALGGSGRSLGATTWPRSASSARPLRCRRRTSERCRPQTARHAPHQEGSAGPTHQRGGR
jgi:hypothetical protein